MNKFHYRKIYKKKLKSQNVFTCSEILEASSIVNEMKQRF
jgi:hypothetical protein